jgi:hypothetical protein
MKTSAESPINGSGEVMQIHQSNAIKAAAWSIIINCKGGINSAQKVVLFDSEHMTFH